MNELQETVSKEVITTLRSMLARHHLMEELSKKQNLVELQRQFDQLNLTDATTTAHLLEMLSPEDRQVVWEIIPEKYKEEILFVLSYDSRLELATNFNPNARSAVIRVFDLHEGILRRIPIESKADLEHAKPIWIDLVKPDDEHLTWARDVFNIDLPAPNSLTDLETSARFYIDDNGEMHLHSDFLLDRNDEARNVPVAFILKRDVLFSVRNEELPAFNVQNMRSLAETEYIVDARDLLLNLYAADVEYSADALEQIYSKLENVGRQVFKSYMTDEQAAKILAAIATEEDLNGHIRRNVLDTRRALSFLMRSKLLSNSQHDDIREILRDIESLDGHTSFLFNKINFQMDATVGFINVNQNKDLKRLTILTVIFMPLNLIAGMGGMSEFSMMTEGIPWQYSYAGLTLGLGVIAWLTYIWVRIIEHRKEKRLAVNNNRKFFQQR